MPFLAFDMNLEQMLTHSVEMLRLGDAIIELLEYARRGAVR